MGLTGAERRNRPSTPRRGGVIAEASWTKAIAQVAPAGQGGVTRRRSAATQSPTRVRTASTGFAQTPVVLRVVKWCHAKAIGSTSAEPRVSHAVASKGSVCDGQSSTTLPVWATLIPLDASRSVSVAEARAPIAAGPPIARRTTSFMARLRAQHSTRQRSRAARARSLPRGHCARGDRVRCEAGLD